MQPLVSIILPCYNAEKYLDYALNSIINQDYKHLEIICINDGSTDSTLTILNHFQQTDNRIFLINNEQNIGLIATLNKALGFVKGEYFARMDADDFSSPSRISEEVNFLLQSPSIDIVSTAYSYFNKDHHFSKPVPSIATLPHALKFLSLFCTPLTHASILAKTNLIHNGSFKYNNAFPHAEDFELFSRLTWQNIKIANINKTLYHIRIHPNSVSAKFSDMQFKTNIYIVKLNFNQFDSSLLIDDDIAGILACKINFIVTSQKLSSAISIIKSCSLKYYKNCSKDEMKQISDFTNLHILNILIQANKHRFKVLRFKNIPFFIYSLKYISIKHFGIISKKIVRQLYS